jgi:hypothetical protein
MEYILIIVGCVFGVVWFISKQNNNDNDNDNDHPQDH